MQKIRRRRHGRIGKGCADMTKTKGPSSPDTSNSGQPRPAPGPEIAMPPAPPGELAREEVEKTRIVAEVLERFGRHTELPVLVERLKSLGMDLPAEEVAAIRAELIKRASIPPGPDQPPPANQAAEQQPAAEVHMRLQRSAELLRQTPHLGPAAQAALAELLESLGEAVAAHKSPPEELTILAQSAAHFVDAAQGEQESGVLAAARDRLTKAVAAAEARAPTLAGITRRVVDALAGLGI